MGPVLPQAIADPQPLLRHQLGDHLESSSLELDEQGSLISYEEYYPYGSTSFQAVDSATEVSAKRYRFTAKERDEESGLYYHGARYYAPWLSRWTAPDPAGMVDGPNLYQYVRGNPVRLVDPDGRESGEGSFADERITGAEVEARLKRYPTGEETFNLLRRVPHESGGDDNHVDTLGIRSKSELDERNPGRYDPYENIIYVSPEVFEQLQRFVEGELRIRDNDFRNAITVLGHELGHSAQWAKMREEYRENVLFQMDRIDETNILGWGMRSSTRATKDEYVSLIHERELEAEIFGRRLVAEIENTLALRGAELSEEQMESLEVESIQSADEWMPEHAYRGQSEERWERLKEAEEDLIQSVENLWELLNLDLFF